MIERQIKMESIEDVRDFVNAATVAPFDIDLSVDRFVVDAKSILGIFSLNLANVITLQMHSEENDDTNQFIRSVEKYIV